MRASSLHKFASVAIPFICSSWRIFTSKASILLGLQQKGRSQKTRAAFSNSIPATTYVPTQLPMQYHRPCEA
jgi:hypothetical protein